MRVLGKRQSTYLVEGAIHALYIGCRRPRSVMPALSALHRAAAAGGGRNRFDADNLKERDVDETAEAKQVRPTGGVIALLTRDDGALVDAFEGLAALQDELLVLRVLLETLLVLLSPLPALLQALLDSLLLRLESLDVILFRLKLGGQLLTPEHDASPS